MDAPDETTRQAVQEARTLVRLLGLDRGHRVLDLGCGPGHRALALAEEELEVAAADVSRRLLAEGRARAKERDLPVRFIESDGGDLKFNEDFEAVLCLGPFAFSELPDDQADEALLDRLCHALVPDGQLVLDFWHAPYALQNGLVPDLTTLRTTRLEGEPPQQIKRHQRWYVAPEVSALLARTGFEARSFLGRTAGSPLLRREPLALEHPLATVIGTKVVRVVRIKRRRRRNAERW